MRCGNPTLGRFDSGAAPLGRLRLPQGLAAVHIVVGTRRRCSRLRPLETARRGGGLWQGCGANRVRVIGRPGTPRQATCAYGLGNGPWLAQREGLQQTRPRRGTSARGGSRGQVAGDQAWLRRDSILLAVRRILAGVVALMSKVTLLVAGLA